MTPLEARLDRMRNPPMSEMERQLRASLDKDVFVPLIQFALLVARYGEARPDANGDALELMGQWAKVAKVFMDKLPPTMAREAQRDAAVALGYSRHRLAAQDRFYNYVLTSVDPHGSLDDETLTALNNSIYEAFIDFRVYLEHNAQPTVKALQLVKS